ncbi:hypothetical protein [Pseudodesulfovibrio piezophilus]|uniref:hypothetical protein n=1 Tax=Pseudodesulfovibrio piezophilus TaxID=879567 RepID=UPI00034AE642|nr:hypothetical protein [Pseudodesulfovibrio piezophilus]
MPFTTLGYCGKDRMFIVIKLLLEVGSIFGRLIAGDILLPVNQPFTKEVMRFVFLLNNCIEPIQIMVRVPLLLLRLLSLVLIFDAYPRIMGTVTRCAELWGQSLIFLLLIR